MNAQQIQAVQYFHHESHYYSESEDCPAMYMGDARGTYDKEKEVWTPLTDEAANAYWEKCDCLLREVVEKLLGGKE